VTVARQCELLGVPRSTHYYRPRPASADAAALKEEAMAAIDRARTACPCCGSRKISMQLAAEPFRIRLGRKGVASLMAEMGIRAVAPAPSPSKRPKGAKASPYLLRGMDIWLPNQVWAIDITYIPMGRGHMYLTAATGWHTRLLLGWELSDTLEAAASVECMSGAIGRHGVPAVANSDQGSQFHSEAYVSLLASHGIRQSMDGKARWAGSARIERWFRSLKCECLYINEYSSPRELRAGRGCGTI